jgi:PadR family transcriptional regulator, regulatory protein AphA
MALEHILLGLLRKPGSGTDIKQAFEEAIGHFWHAELSQVYPMLNRMEADGLLTVEQLPSEKGPPRKVYTITDTGRETLRTWLSNRPAVNQERLEWLAQVWFLDETPEHALDHFQSMRADFSRELAALQAIEDYWRTNDPRYPDALSDEDFFPSLTLALGLKKLAAIVAWCDECIARIEKRK